MFLNTPFSFSFRIALYLVLIISIGACAPAATQAPQMIVEAATPTPEVFNPLNPSPTPSGSTLPMTCQVTDLNVYVNEEWGYCFAYPTTFTIDEGRALDGVISLYGSALEDNADPVRAMLEITTQPVPEQTELVLLVDSYLKSFPNLPWTITRESLMLGGEPAEKLEPIRGLSSSRIVMALHNNILFTLRFHPSDIVIAKPDLEALTQTVTGSFAFLPGSVSPSSRIQTVSWLDFGQNISLSYDSILAPWVEAMTVPTVPVRDQVMFAESCPAHAQIRFLGFQGGRLYELPLLPAENRVAQVMVFQTTDFSGYGDDNPQGFVSQLQALKDLLESGIDPARCENPFRGYDMVLPFLPWINAQQSFCAQPQMIEFAGGKGIRYLSHYAQGPSPVLDHQVFYTFQGLTDDGQFYVSALFPVQTGIFPTNPPPCPNCEEPNYDPFAEWATVLSEQLTQLNAQLANDFAPSLTILDNMIKSIQLDQ